MMKKKLTGAFFGILMAAVLFVPAQITEAASAALSQKAMSLTEGESEILELKNNKKKVKWTVISGKKYIKLSNKKISSVKITAKKKGNAKVQAKVGKKKYICKINVKKATSEKNTEKKIDGKSAADVKALKKLIEEQKALGATVSENLDDGTQYEWGDGGTYNGKLLGINWEGKQLKGSISLTAFDALGNLHVNNNQLTSLDASKNSRLTYLYCQQNQLTSLYLDSGENLVYLQCEQNQLTSLNLDTCKKLTDLLAANNQITALNLDNATKLKRAMLGGNPLGNLNITKNKELVAWDCSLCGLTALDVTQNINLEVLTCAGNQITELNLTNNINLKEVACTPFVNIIGMPAGCVKNILEIKRGKRYAYCYSYGKYSGKRRLSFRAWIKYFYRDKET